MFSPIPDAGAQVTVVAAHAPVNSAAGTISGTAIDRAVPGGQDYFAGTLHVAVGAASGTPDSFTVNAKVKHCATSGGSYVALTDRDGNEVAIDAIVADNGEATINVDLTGADEFIKVEPVVAFVNGTSPKIDVASTLVLFKGRSIT